MSSTEDMQNTCIYRIYECFKFALYMFDLTSVLTFDILCFVTIYDALHSSLFACTSCGIAFTGTFACGYHIKWKGVHAF